MSEEDTYVRAKLTEINGAIERLTQMLNRMIDVISAITEVQENTSELTRTVNANTERLDALIQMVKNLELSLRQVNQVLQKRVLFPTSNQFLILSKLKSERALLQVTWHKELMNPQKYWRARVSLDP